MFVAFFVLGVLSPSLLEGGGEVNFPLRLTGPLSISAIGIPEWTIWS